jgi:hypothetical protein
MAPPGGFDYAEWIGENAKETTVAIDRQTGIVIHPTIGNAQFQLWGNIEVIDAGSSDWGFKVVAISPDGGQHRNFRYYEVQEYASGSKSLI